MEYRRWSVIQGDDLIACIIYSPNSPKKTLISIRMNRDKNYAILFDISNISRIFALK